MRVRSEGNKYIQCYWTTTKYIVIDKLFFFISFSNIINNRLNSIKMKHFNLYFNRIFHFQLNRFRNDWRSMHTPTPVHCSNHIKQRWCGQMKSVYNERVNAAASRPSRRAALAHYDRILYAHLPQHNLCEREHEHLLHYVQYTICVCVCLHMCVFLLYKVFIR